MYTTNGSSIQMVYSGYERTKWLLDMDRNTYAVFLHLLIEYTCVIVHIWAFHHRHWCIMPVGSIKRVISYIITNITRDVLPNINRMQATERAGKCRFWSLVTLTFDLDIQTRPIEGSNTSSVWIWRKSIQRFQRYFVHKQKPRTDGAKKEPSTVYCVQ